MHISFLNPPGEYYSPVSGGAVATIIMEVARQLISRGHRVSIVTQVNAHELYGIGEIVPMELPDRKDLSFLQRAVSSFKRRINRWERPYYDYYRKALAGALRTLQPDAVILFNDLISSADIRRELPRAHISVWLQNEWSSAQRHLERTIATTDTFFTCSEYIRFWTAGAYGIPQSRFSVAAGGVDLDAFHPDAARIQTAGPLRVLFIGRIDRNKGPDIAADAVATLQKRGVKIELTVAGGLWWYGHGREMQNPFFCILEQKMKATGANYIGHVPRPCVPQLLREHDVVCVLSRSNEPFALVTREAMASGCAVVASHRGGLPESCGQAAMLVDPEDFEAVVECLHALANDRALLQRQKRKSLERARRAPWSACADIVEGALTHA